MKKKASAAAVSAGAAASGAEAASGAVSGAAGAAGAVTSAAAGAAGARAPAPLAGLRRELTREMFEELCALQCRLPEILGYVGTTEEKLARWCRRLYRLPLADVLRMLRQDGLIEIRRAGFDQLRKSATLIGQQYTRYLSDPEADQAAHAAEELARRIFSVSDPGEDEVSRLFGGEEGECP